jgi:hypothetical protein
MMWESPGAFDFCNVITISNLSAVANQSIDVYFMQCSLSTSNTTVVLDMQTNTTKSHACPTAIDAMERSTSVDIY